MYNVLILCTGNSCRSQMAEALINHYFAHKIYAKSAGTIIQPTVADDALMALSELGLNTKGLHPKSLDTHFK